MKVLSLGSIGLLIITVTVQAQAPRVAEPVKVTMENGTPLEVGSVGHAAPVYHDFDGDGVPDLIVGEFEDGACRVFRNYGTATEPIFRDFEFFHAGGKKAKVPPD